MKSHYRVVVIGGGVVGCSVLYHLAKFGWKDVCLIERSVLTAGSSWHAAGGVHALNADPNMAALQAYTIDLLTEVEAESGQSIGLHMTGGITVASAPARWEWLKSAYRIFQTVGIEDCHLMSPEEIRERCPIMNVDGVIGGLWADREGYVDTTGTVHAYAAAAKKRGAEIIEHCRVTELSANADGSWDVITENGIVRTEHVVNAAGLWAKQVGRMAGLELPLSPLQHHYFVTDTIPEVAELDFEVPMTVDLEGFTYMRQDQKGILVGIYERDHKHWQIDGAPWEYGIELIEEELDRISDELDMAFRRYPVLENTGIKNWVNGAFTFSPDGNPLVGPVRGTRNYWLACGVMAGFLQGGGVGKSLAEWMIHGETETDSWSMDIARYGDFAQNREYIRQTTGQFYSRRFVMTYPNEQLWAGRPLKKSPSYQAMRDDGARFGENWGLESPIYFAPAEFEEIPTLKRSNAFDIIGEECRAARESAGLLDISGYSRFRVQGVNAASWLNRLLAGRLPDIGKCGLAPMLAPSGRLRGDLMLLHWDDNEWWLMGSYYLREWHLRWFHDHLAEGVSVEDISDRVVGFSLVGPKSRDALQRLTHSDVSNAAFPFMHLRQLDVGLVRARVARVSVSGELGYEINCAASDHATLYRCLSQVCGEQGGRNIGMNALLSLRLEKSFGIWNAEFMQAYRPGETGLDRWIDFAKPDFIGKQAAHQERMQGTGRRLVTLAVDATDADATGYEPVWKDRNRVGFVTSGGYGHVVGQSLAMAFVAEEFSAFGTELTCHVVGEERTARVIAPSPHDPKGLRMRA
ncbi:MAG: FAD-dependent oxidoreductase [Rhodobacteraceae bacterium]|nr:FAD-dependent oxidoreductase [Paracoccaceae bacterium]